VIPLFVLAIDHRDSLRRWHRERFGPRPDEHEVLRALKHLALDGLLAALGDDLGRAEVALLTDDEYGADVLARAKRSGIATAVAVEKSGEREFCFEHDAHYANYLDALDPTFAKALVRYNPRGDVDRNSRSRERLGILQQHLRDRGRPLIVELLVPPEPFQLDALDGDRARYDRVVRPELTLDALDELIHSGLQPRYWKVEGQATLDAYRRLAVVAAGDIGSGCLVLGRGEDRPIVDRWISLAAQVDGFAGFAVGRTIWLDAVLQWRLGRATYDQAVVMIADAFRRLVMLYRDNAHRLAGHQATVNS